jgi:hypothetical protein
MNKEATKLQAKQTKEQHHNPQVVELDEGTELFEGDPFWEGGDLTEREKRDTRSNFLITPCKSEQV